MFPDAGPTRHAARTALAVAAMLAATACHTMKEVQAYQLTAGAVGAVWVTKNDHSTVILHAPRVTGDTIAGFIDGAFSELPLSETTKLVMRAPDRGRTVAIGVTTGVTLLAAMIYFENRSYVGDGQTCYRSASINDGQAVPCCAGKTTISC